MRLIVLDTETTGLPDRDALCRIIEVGAVVADIADGQVTIAGRFQSLVNPGRLHWDRPECAKALEVNCLTPAQIQAAPPPFIVAQELRSWINVEGCGAVGMTAYGTDFDFDPLLLGAPEWLARTMFHIGMAPCLRTAAREQAGLGKYDRGYKLEDMLKRHGISREGDAHAALSDAIGAAMLIPKVLPNLSLDDIAPPIKRWWAESVVVR